MAYAGSPLPPTPTEEQISAKLADLLAAKTKPAPVAEPALRSAEPRTPGVYFGLSSAEYHADPSLGSADLKRLVAAPILYWHHSHMNPRRPEDKDTPAKLRGRALHKLVLEGEAALAKAYAETPTPQPGDLVSLEDLKGACRSLALPVSGTKAQLGERLRGVGSPAPIFDDVLREFQARLDSEGLEPLSREQMAEVRTAAASIGSNPHLRKAFAGGLSEVSVFWREAGVPLKARFDYLKPKAIVDLKSVSNPREHPVDVAIRASIAAFRYDVQALHYFSAYAALRSLANDGHAQGACRFRADWHKRLHEDPAFIWCFVLVDAPIVRALQLTETSAALNRARREISMAKRAYVECLDRWGTAAPWFDDEPPRELTADDMAPWLRESVEVL
jgi:hypothetical protein